MPSDLAPKLRSLADRGVFIGTSSWKYPGWIGDIYTGTKYETRGKFSQTKFDATCLEEYAETFPVVGGDFSFYQFPTDAFWAKLFASAPPGLRFGFKVPEEVTCAKFPTHPRYGARKGMENPNFLAADVFMDATSARGTRCIETVSRVDICKSTSCDAWRQEAY